MEERIERMLRELKRVEEEEGVEVALLALASLYASYAVSLGIGEEAAVRIVREALAVAARSAVAPPAAMYA